MSDNTPQQPSSPEPSYGAVPPAPPTGAPYDPPAASPYGAPPAAPSYDAPPVAPPYAGGSSATYPQTSYPAPTYGYGGYEQQKTNVLAIVSMIASIVGFVWILPFIGSLAGIIMGHISLSQIKRTGDKGRGMALAGVIVGYVGLALVILGTILIFGFIAWAAQQDSSYDYSY